jgi:hypothetical protein
MPRRSVDPRPAPASTAPVEVWENPDHPFAATAAAVRQYAAQGDWAMLFNAMILTHAVLRAERGDATQPLSSDPESHPAS